MSHAPLPLGLGATMAVTVAELGGRTVTVHRLTGKMIPVLQRVKDNPDDVTANWGAVRAFVPELTEDEVLDLTLDSVLKIIALASQPVEVVERMLAKGTGAATDPPATP